MPQLEVPAYGDYFFIQAGTSTALYNDESRYRITKGIVENTK